MALSDKSMKVSMKGHTQNYNSGMYSICEGGNIDCVTLDSLNINKKIDLLKIDTEGTELMILKGVTDIIIKNHPVIVLEMNDLSRRFYNITDEEIVTYLEQFNYKIQYHHLEEPGLSSDVIFY
jgi:hypothetical protein